MILLLIPHFVFYPRAPNSIVLESFFFFCRFIFSTTLLSRAYIMRPFHGLNPGRTISFAWLIDIAFWGRGIKRRIERQRALLSQPNTAGSPVPMKEAKCYKATRSLAARASTNARRAICHASPVIPRLPCARIRTLNSKVRKTNFQWMTR
jgi:hypothetical protein